SNPGNTTLNGAGSVAASGGVAAFTGLSINKASPSPYRLQASVTGLAAALTSTLTVTPGAATQLLFTTQPPATLRAGAGFSVTVKAEDAFGNVDPSFGETVLLALSSNPGGGTLGGTLSVKAKAGVAIFTGLSINKPGNGY